MNLLRKLPWSRLFSERGIVFIIIAVLILIIAVAPTFTTSLERAFIRTAIALRGGLPAAPEIVIAEIDARSTDKTSEWPWRAKTFTNLMKKLGSMNVGLIAIDPEIVQNVDFSKIRLSKNDREKPAIAMGYEFYPSLADMPPVIEEKPQKHRKMKTESDIEGISFPSMPANDSTLPGMTGINRHKLPGNLRNRAVEGYYNIFEDPNKTVTGQPLAVRFQGRAMPAFAVAILSSWRGFTPILAEDPKGFPSGINIGDEFISTGPDARVTIGFRGPAGTFPRINAGDIIQEKTISEDLSGKIVILALNTGDSRRQHETIVGTMDDVEIQANILDNLSYGRTLTPWTNWQFMIPFLIVLGLAISFGILALSLTKRLVALAIVLASCWVAGLILLYAANIWFPVIQLSFASILIAFAMAVWRLIARTLPRHRLMGQYGWRMARSSIESLVIDCSPVRAEGHRCDITALAIDIKGFGAIADRLPANELTKFVMEYRMLVTDTIIRHGGMIVSWTGDDCRAAFGAPIPLTEHTLRACLAALDLRKVIKSHVGTWGDSFDIERLNIGVGIQKGTATAGDLGLGYSIVGGAMEAALQLRTQNRLYRTWALVGNAVKESTESAMKYRQLDPVYLWGEKGPATIYELVGESGTILPSMKGFEEARLAYLEGRFDRAVELFQVVLDSYPHDGPSRLFLRRARTLQQTPPESWNGIWRQS